VLRRFTRQNFCATVVACVYGGPVADVDVDMPPAEGDLFDLGCQVLALLLQQRDLLLGGGR
jgi:hypothetical protein